eukprot:6209769-Pleurochrysis_carterae.AAC.1
MSPSTAMAHMHSRLHAGLNRIRNLPKITADAPPSLTHGISRDVLRVPKLTQPGMQPHTTPLYKPSYPGRLVHADIA